MINWCVFGAFLAGSTDFSVALRFLFITGVILFFVFVTWLFYKTISLKDPLKLNLSKYNSSNHHVLKKFFAIILYLIEYIIIIPVLIVVWYFILSLSLAVLSTEELPHIVLISGGVILAIRILAYYHNELSEDLAKLFPFISLSVILLSSKLVDFGNMLNSIDVLPQLIDEICLYCIVIFLVELVLRIFDSIDEFWNS